MTLFTLIAKNPLRTRARTALTIAAVAVSVIGFVTLRTVLDAWRAGAEHAAEDRLMTRHKMSLGLPLPKRYFDDIATRVPGIRSATYCDWFGGRWAQRPEEFFANLACADNAFDLYPEMRVSAADMARWQRDKQGAIIGDMLARHLGLHVGDHVTLQGTFYPGDWQLTIDGIYTVTPQSTTDRSSFFFHWNYKNERVGPRDQNMIGWIFARIDDGARAPEISRAIDALFDERDVRTTTMSERGANTAFLGAVSAVLTALDIMSLILLAIIALILGNTLAMSVRERTKEYAVLAALGFPPLKLRVMFVAEALLLSSAGVLFGLALSFPIVQLGMGGWLEENMGKYFPVFRIATSTQLSAIGATLALGASAALLPALQLGRLQVADVLRKVT